LPVKLVEADRLVISADQTAVIKAQEEVEAAKRLAVAGFNAKIKEHKKKVHELNENLLAGVVYREVEVRIDKDFATGKARTIRVDTGEEVISKDIDPDERQTVLGLPGPGAQMVGLDGGPDGEQAAGTPEEAEALREERLAGERVERISAAVEEARARITVLAMEVLEGEPAMFSGTVQVRNRVIEETGFSEAQTVAAVVAALTEWAEAEEDARPEPTPTWDEVKAASAETQRLAEIERLANEQADDQKKNGPKNLLKAPKPKKAKEKKINVVVVEADGTETPVEEPDPADEQPAPAPTPDDDTLAF
jgi:hypothetical protein